MTIAIAAFVLGALIATPTKKVIDFRFKCVLEHLAGSLADQLFEHIVRRRDGCGRRQNLIPCRHGVTLLKLTRVTESVDDRVVRSSQDYCILYLPLRQAPRTTSTREQQRRSHMAKSPGGAGLTVSAAPASGTAVGGMLVPLVLAQFLCSFAATTMNVAISSIASDLGTTVSGVQTAITAFTLTMAALMIPGSKLTDIWGRKLCFRLGLVVYASGRVGSRPLASATWLDRRATLWARASARRC